MAMARAADRFLDDLAAELPDHAALLAAVRDICRSDPRLRTLEIQCSVARGAGDRYSDLDIGIGAADDMLETVVAELPDRLRQLGDTIEVLVHRIAAWGDRPHRRIFVQYADGRQIDLVVSPAETIRGRVPGAVVLHDPDGRMAEPRDVPLAVATADDVREWEVGGWELLANVDKYLARGSAWEARARLDAARDAALRLWAVAAGVQYPAFGLTSLLDADPPRLPDGLEATLPDADGADLPRAARACAELLRDAATRARAALGTSTAETPMARWVTEHLAGRTLGA
jgi:predicted nucleotidyltransferase